MIQLLIIQQPRRLTFYLASPESIYIALLSGNLLDNIQFNDLALSRLLNFQKKVE